LLYDAGRTPLLRRGLAAQPPAVGARPLDLDFSGELHLLGADLPAGPVASGAPLNVTLYWQAEHPLGVDYGFEVWVVDGARQRWDAQGASRPADWRFVPGTDNWPADQYIMDPYILHLLPGTPPGQYTVEANVFARYNLQSIGTQPVGSLTVGSPARAPACPADQGGALTLNPALQLHQASAAPAAAGPGDVVTLSLCWQATAAPGADQQGQLRLADSTGMVLLARTFPLGGTFPASRWASGDVVRDQVSVLLPAALGSGAYSWSMSVTGADGIATAPAAIGLLSVTAPARGFTAPPVQTTLNAALGPITLYGLSGLNQTIKPGGDLALSLAWLDTATPPRSYNVFVHLQAPDGHIVAQSDGVPANWTRRTTGWLPGEYVLDPRPLRLPPDLQPGQYSLFAGLYDPASGERLTTQEFSDGQVPLGQVVVDTK
jgi:hypothetical protein